MYMQMFEYIYMILNMSVKHLMYIWYIKNISHINVHNVY